MITVLDVVAVVSASLSFTTAMIAIHVRRMRLRAPGQRDHNLAVPAPHWD